jgi:hypothetical protein
MTQLYAERDTAKMKRSLMEATALFVGKAVNLAGFTSKKPLSPFASERVVAYAYTTFTETVPT